MATRKITSPSASTVVAAKTSSLTEQQHAAIHRRDVSIALSAGAGCGKTFVLTERFLSHLQPTAADQPPPAELKELIAITFTERAAREMRQRIRAKCLQRLQNASEGDVPHWTRLLRELDAARVSTIHSFCASLLRAHAAEAGLDPRFGLLDPVQADTLLTEAADDVSRELLSAHEETALGLCVQFGLETVRNMTASLLGERHEIDFAAWLERKPEQIVALWAQQHREVFLPAMLHELAQSATAQELLRLLPDAQCDHPKMLVQLATLAERLPLLAESSHPPEDLQQLRDATMLRGFGTKKNWADQEFFEQYSACAKKLRDALDKALGCCRFDAAAVLPDAIAGQQILSIAQKILFAYDERKRQLGLLDFDDLLNRAASLLRDHPKLLQRLTRQVKLLLVDEFQDTDPLQVSLVKALCGDGLQTGKLFFVGDFKQSIYRFRGAKPAVFRELESQMPAEGRLPLTLNFRSQPAVLHFVNALFQGAFGDSYAPLQAHRPQLSPTPAIEFLWAVTGLSSREGGATQTARWQEADAIARRIRQLLDDGVPRVIDAGDQGPAEMRPVRPGDIAILFRALSDVAHYERALQDHGIDYYLVGGHAFYAQQEIFDLLNLLRTLASPADEVSLAGVLRSPMFALADETLFWISRHAGGLAGGFFDAPPPAQLDAEQQRRVTFAAETICYLRQRKDRLPIAQLIDEALQRTGYDAVLLAEFLGARKLANLHKLISQARAIDQTGALGLADFIVQLADLVAEQPKEALAATHPESSQVVRLMSIHQSKGLEFPIVVVADIDRKKNSSSDSIAFSPQLGPLVRAPNARKNADLFSGLDLFKLENRAEEDREQTRLLYVATTRAADMLILSSGLSAVDQLQGPWTKLLAERFDLSSGQCTATLPADYAAPRVAVLTPEAKSPTKISVADSVDWEKLWLEIQRDGQVEKVALPLVAPVAHRPPLRQEYSFSRLHGETKPTPYTESAAADQDEDIVSARVNAIDLGTLVHGALEEIDFAQPGDLAALLQRHAQRHPSSLDDELPVALKLLEKFVASPRAAALSRAKQVQRELEFLLAWPPVGIRGSSVAASPASGLPDANLRLTGIIDCLYCDSAGQWHLVDYKTNQVTAKNVTDVADGYRLQMSVYALAVETILQQSPASLTLHFLRSGTEIPFPWNDAVREQAIALVNRQLAAVV